MNKLCSRIKLPPTNDAPGWGMTLIVGHFGKWNGQMAENIWILQCHINIWIPDTAWTAQTATVLALLVDTQYKICVCNLHTHQRTTFRNTYFLCFSIVVATIHYEEPSICGSFSIHGWMWVSMNISKFIWDLYKEIFILQTRYRPRATTILQFRLWRFSEVRESIVALLHCPEKTLSHRNREISRQLAFNKRNKRKHTAAFHQGRQALIQSSNQSL